MIIPLFNTNAILLLTSKRNYCKIAFVVLSVLLLNNSSFGKDQELNYLKNGVSFSLPGNWRTISDEPLPDKGYYYSAECTDKNSNGLFTLVTINNEENPIKALLVQQKKHDR